MTIQKEEYLIDRGSAKLPLRQYADAYLKDMLKKNKRKNKQKKKI